YGCSVASPDFDQPTLSSRPKFFFSECIEAFHFSCTGKEMLRRLETTGLMLAVCCLSLLLASSGRVALGETAEFDDGDALTEYQLMPDRDELLSDEFKDYDDWSKRNLGSALRLRGKRHMGSPFRWR
uniref:Pro-FMRFamide-related neuropeptide FF n=1 Tax=Macrostomum lignano TaxID=282301 RepID=A0A1I8IIH1_9PLAT